MRISTYRVPPDAGLLRYLQAVHAMPMLTAEEEFHLAHLWHDKRDTAAANKLVTSHLRLVARIAAGYRGYGVPLNDLIGAGNVGMMQSVQRFDPDRGFRLATYAICWIRAAIQEYVLHSASLVKMGTTASQKKLFFNLRRIKRRMNTFDNGDLPLELASKIAEALDVPAHDVMTMNLRMAMSDQSLNAPVYGDDADQWQDHFLDASESHETVLADREIFEMRKSSLSEAISVPNQRERRILKERFLTDAPATLANLAHEYGVSRERIRQIESRALVKLHKAMKLSSTTHLQPEGTSAAPTEAYP